MRRACTVSGLRGVYLRLSQEITNLFDRRDLLGGVPTDRLCRRRLLRIEPLEPRQFLSGNGLLSTVAPTWFQDVIGGTNAPSHVGAAAWTAEGAGAAAASPAESDGSGNSWDWIVQFNTADVQGLASVAEVSSLLVGGGVEFDVIRGLGLVGQVLVRSFGASAEAAASALAQNVHIAGFEQDALRQLEVTPNDPQTGSLYGINKIQAPEAWNLTTGSHSVVVGVIDTGIDYTHPDLAANIWTNPGEIAGNGVDDDHNGFIDDVHGYDFINNDGNPMDDHGHGTHVAGTIAAVGNNGVGVVGVDWNASLMALKFLNANGSGYTSDAIRAVNYATMMRTQYGVNLRVLNNSWGGSGYDSQLASAIQASNNAGILFVAAAGNNGTNNDYSPQYPASYNIANVVSVAATDSNDTLASFSCYGANTVDLAAPGVSILSTVPSNRYAWYSGTSMATPHVSGAAALAWAYQPDATVAEIKNALLQGVDPVAGLAGKMVSGGRLNVYHTLQQLGVSAPTPTPIFTPPTLGSLTATPASATPGTTVTLTAAGATVANGQIVSISFYTDANANGTLDVGDPLLATVSNVLGGQAQYALNTSGYSAGTYRYLARALDNHSQLSNTVTTTLTLIPADDYGNSPATAAAINVGATLGGTIEKAGDVDWFKFQAVKGTRYTVSTALAGLADTVLYLYDRNGSTQLAWNDDYGGTWASSLTWTPTVSGQYYLKVKAYSTAQTGGYRLSLAAYAPPADDHGNTAAKATTINVGQTVAGMIGTSGDVDFFRFSAQAKTRYAITCTLAGLPGSKVQLIDRNGAKILATVTNTGGTNSSQLEWRAPASGTYFLRISGLNPGQMGNYQLTVAVRFSAPPSNTLPTIGALIASPNTVSAGSPVLLQAQGIYDPNGQVRRVYFYRDSNGNGVWDSRDLLIGSTSRITNETANFAINTFNLQGNFRFFARALDNSYRYSSPVTTTLTVSARASSRAAAAEDLTSIPAAAIATQNTLVQIPGISDGWRSAGEPGLYCVRDQVLANRTFQNEELNFLSPRPMSENSGRYAERQGSSSVRLASSVTRRLSEASPLGVRGARDALFAGETVWDRHCLAEEVSTSRTTRELVSVIDRLLSRLDE